MKTAACVGFYISSFYNPIPCHVDNHPWITIFSVGRLPTWGPISVTRSDINRKEGVRGKDLRYPEMNGKGIFNGRVPFITHRCCGDEIISAIFQSIREGTRVNGSSLIGASFDRGSYFVYVPFLKGDRQAFVYTHMYTV